MKATLATILLVLLAFLALLRVRLLSKAGAKPASDGGGLASQARALFVNIARTPWTASTVGDESRFTEIAGFDPAEAPLDEFGQPKIHMSDGVKTASGEWFIQPGELVLIKDNKTGEYV